MSLTSNSWFRKKRPVGQEELEGALELIPQPVLVVDASQRVLAINQPASLLFNQPRQELVTKTLNGIFRHLPEDFALPSDQANPPSQFLGEIEPPGQQCLDVNLKVNRLTANSDYFLITLEPVTIRRSPAETPDLHTQFWQGLFLLASAAEQSDIDACLKTVLEGARALLPCQIATLYLCKTGDLNRNGTEQPTIPLANRNATRWGADEQLPATVTPQDLLMFRTIRVWDGNKRPMTGLQRAAREAGFSYLAVAPLGLPQKLTGLIALGDLENEPPAALLHMVQFIAAMLSFIMDEQERRFQMNRTIESQGLQLRVLDTALGTVQDGVFILAPDLRVRRINLASETILGYKNREVEGQPIHQILIGNEQILPALNMAQKGSPTYHLNDIQLLRRYGDSFKALVRILPIHKQAEVESILVVVRDLSEQAAYEAHARQLAQNAELGEVMAAFAHEVRNPINNISSGLQVMERTLPESDPQREDVRMLLMDVDRVAELMKTMLSVTRTSDLKPRSMDLGILVSNLIDRLKQSIKRDGISCQANIENGLPQVYGDPRALEQVFNNLVRNAIQAMKGRPESQLIVKVHALKAAKDRMFVEVSIADNGPGIPKENQDKIFQPFFTTKTDGNGLGLPLAKRIITAHKGSIAVTSFPGGTVFKVTLPALDRTRQTGPLPYLEEIPETPPSNPVVENPS